MCAGCEADERRQDHAEFHCPCQCHVHDKIMNQDYDEEMDEAANGKINSQGRVDG